MVNRLTDKELTVNSVYDSQRIKFGRSKEPNLGSYCKECLFATENIQLHTSLPIVHSLKLSLVNHAFRVKIADLNSNLSFLWID